MLVRAILAFLAMPGVVAFAIPLSWMLLWREQETSMQWGGLAPLAAGVIGLLWCVRDFYVAGKGTLAPWSPPQRLVVVGLYRYSRNPMYLSVICILLGWTVLFRSSGLLIYAVAIAILFHLRVVFGEEPWLARIHGDQWSAYTARVPRWFDFRSVAS